MAATNSDNLKQLNWYFRKKDITIIETILNFYQTHNGDKIAAIEGVSGAGKTTMARVIAENLPNTKTYWLRCGTVLKTEHSLRELARSLNISSNINHVACLIKEIKEVLRGRDTDQYLLIFDDLVSNWHINILAENLPPNIRVLITTQSPEFDTIPLKLTLDPYTAPEIVQFIGVATQCNLTADGYKNLLASIKLYFNHFDAEIEQPIIVLNQMGHFLNEVIVKKTPNPFNRATVPPTTEQIVDTALRPDNITHFICQIFKKYSNESLDVARILHLDTDFIDLSILSHPPRASDNGLEDFLDELEAYGVIHRTENCSGSNGITMHRYYVRNILDNFTANSKKEARELLGTIEFFMSKILVDNMRDANESHKAYMHALKLRDFQFLLPNAQQLQLFNCIIAYQRFWRVDEKICIALEHDKIQKLPNSDADHEDHASNAYFSLGLSYLAFGRDENALESFKHVVGIRERMFGNGYHTLFSVFFKIGECYFNQKAYANAISSLERALNIMHSYRGNSTGIYLAMKSEAPMVYNLMGLCLDRSDEYVEAKRYFKMALAAKKRLSGDVHRGDLAQIYQNLALLYARFGRVAKAIENLKRAAELFASYLGEEHLKLAAIYEEIGELYEEKRSFEKAARYYGLAQHILLVQYSEKYFKFYDLRKRIVDCNKTARKGLWRRVKGVTSGISLRGKSSCFSKEES